jgi:hypothetical protein
VIVFDGRGILLDVEGTTSSISFVYDVLFAHAKAKVGEFLAAHRDDARVMELAAAATQAMPARGLALLDGIITAVLGGMLIAQWPSDSLWAIGTIFGLSLAFSALNLLTAPANGNAA